MQNKIPQATLEINLDNIAANYLLLKEKLSENAVCAAVVKANAYGLGVKYVAPKLYNAGCREFYVAHAAEGVELRKILADKPAQIYILHGFYGAETNDILEHNLVPVLNSLPDIELWAEEAKKRNIKLAANIHIDTGMNRLGLGAADVKRLQDRKELLEALDIRYVMSHLACADDPSNKKNLEQLDGFKALSSGIAPYSLSFANSAGIFLGNDYHFQQARPGCALYGINPQNLPKNPMHNVVSLKAPIIQIREVGSGETIGYGADYLVKKTIKLATISVGYADGLLRSFAGGNVYVNKQKCPVLGRISMDVIVADIGEVTPQVKVGDQVEVIGDQQTADDVAKQAKTIGYEILTSLGFRYKKIYSNHE